jgi:ribosomal protein S18 acetylase RimI-like enzyme
MSNLTHRKATLADLPIIVDLLFEDDLGQTREQQAAELDPRYVKAFQAIDADPNQYLVVVEKNDEIVGTCQLTIMPSLTFTGATRLQIEAVRVAAKYRGQKIGEWMMQVAIAYAKEKGVTIIQLTTNKSRERAKQFYEQLGFKATHEGMKLYFY